MVVPIERVMSKQDKVNISERVADSLRSSILQGEVEPGQRLPSERSLAEKFNVTRTTLREALKKLEQLKLVGMRQGQGITVRDFKTASMDLLSYLLSMDGKLDEQLMHNVLEARVLLVTEVTRLAALRANKQEIAQLEESLEALLHCKNIREYQLLDFEFYRLLAVASHNLVYALLMNTIKHIHSANVDLFLGITVDTEVTAQSAIVEAVKQGNAVSAAGVAQAYLQQGMENFTGSKGFPHEPVRKI